jgi:hypothetical protein
VKSDGGEARPREGEAEGRRMLGGGGSQVDWTGLSWHLMEGTTY